MKKDKKSFIEYGQQTQKYMRYITQYLIEKYGKINDEWYISLTMLADNIEILDLSKKRLKSDGIMIPDRFGNMVKHPLLKTIVDCNIQIVKLLNEFGLTPKAVYKLRDTAEVDDSPLAQFLIEQR